MAKKRGKHGRPTGSHNPKPKRPSDAKPAVGPRKPSQTERLEAARRLRRRRSVRRRAAAIAAVVVVVAGFVMWRVSEQQSARRTIAALTGGLCRYDTRSDPGRVNEHAASVTFKVDPPSGGVHEQSVAQGGTYTERNQPPDGRVVHALEHGLIAISYRPDLAEEEGDVLEEIADANEEDVLLLPRSSLGVPVAATAWHRRLLCDEMEPESLRRFIRAYVNKGPENVPGR